MHSNKLLYMKQRVLQVKEENGCSVSQHAGGINVQLGQIRGELLCVRGSVV